MVKKKKPKAKKAKTKKVKKKAPSRELTPVLQERAEAYALMNVALRKVADSIQLKLDKLQTQGVITFYEIGQAVTKACGNRGRYGDHAMDKLSAYFSQSVGTLRVSRVFVEIYPVKKVRDLTRAAEKNGHQFTQSHWALLCQRAGARNATIRKKGELAIIERGLSVRALEKELKDLEGHSTRGAPQGRKPSAPKTPFAGLDQMSRWQRDIGSRMGLMKSAVIDPLASMEEVTEDAIAKVENTQADLLDASKALADLADDLGSTATKMKKHKKSGKATTARKPERMAKPTRKGAGKSKPKSKKRSNARDKAKKAAAAAKKKKPAAKKPKRRPVPA